MTDIVEELRERERTQALWDQHDEPLWGAAANEIERLRAVLDSRLRVALDNRQALDELVAAESKIRSLQAEIERLEGELRSLRAIKRSDDGAYEHVAQMCNDQMVVIEELRTGLLRMICTSGRLMPTDGSSDALFLLLDARTAACELLGMSLTGDQ